MAINFKPWVDTPTAGQQVQSASVFASDTQRVDGFKAGDPASALRVNSALRQANIVIAGLMQFCDEVKTLPNDLSLLSTVTQVKNAIKDSIDTLHDTTLTSAKDYTDTRETAINTSISNVQNQVTENKNDIGTLVERVDEHDDEIAGLSGGTSTLTTRVETLETEMNTAQADIDAKINITDIQNVQSTLTNKVPSSNLLKESSFARVYREATEISGITYPVTIGALVKAIMDANLVNCVFVIGMNNATETKVTGLPTIGETPQTYGTLTIIMGSSALRMRIEYNKDVGNDATLMWIGSINRSVTPYTVTWKLLIDDSSAQDITGVKKFTASPIVPTSPSGPSAAVAKSYVDGALANPTILGNGDFFRNDNGMAIYSSPVESCINQFGLGFTQTTGSYTVATRTLKSDTFETSGKFVFLYQYIDNPARLNGKTVTLSGKAVSTDGYFLLQLWKTIGGTTTELARTTIDRTLSKSVSVTIPSGEFAEGDTLRAIFQTYGETDLDYIKLEIGSLATAYTPEQALVSTNSPETISAIKTFATGATPLITDQPTTDLMATNKLYVDTHAPYDRVIRTQTEFEALIASATWLDATSVAIVGQFTISKASGIEIPENVKQIHGFNSAKITVTNFVHHPSTAKSGLWYATRPTTTDYSIRDLEVDCTGIDSSGFRDCTNLTNCTGTGTASNGIGFFDCTNLTNCTGTGNGTITGYGFYNINYASNCKDGGSKTDMWGGDNYAIDPNTCSKTPVPANEATLNT